MDNHYPYIKDELGIIPGYVCKACDNVICHRYEDAFQHAYHAHMLEFADWSWDAGGEAILLLNFFSFSRETWIRHHNYWLTHQRTRLGLGTKGCLIWFTAHRASPEEFK